MDALTRRAPIIMRRLTALATLLLALGALTVISVSAQAPDEPVDGGWFFSQAGPGEGLGFSVTDADEIPFWTEFEKAGGVAQLGYPVSRRWRDGPFTLQAFQKTIFQWQPGRGLFRLNIFDELSRAGLDDALLSRSIIPKPRAFPADDGQPFSVVMANHLVLLDENEAIKAVWYSNPAWLDDYGLPVAYQDFGDLRVLRAQRAVLQHWMIETDFASPGQVVTANGGDHYKDAGLIPEEATTPHAAGDAVATVVVTPAPSPDPPAEPEPGPAVPQAAPIGSVWNIVAPLVSLDQRVWIGTATGGVLRSTNGGASFTPVNQGLPNLAINAIAPSPTIHEDGLVLVATNEGVARSIDGGVSWAPVAGLPAGRVGGLVISPHFAEDGAVYAVLDAAGLYRSSDRGVNWSAVPHSHQALPRPATYLGMAAAEKRGGGIHLFAWTSTALYESADRGAGFNSLTSGRKVLPAGFRISAVAIHPAWRSQQQIWLGSESHGIYRSTDQGKTYQQVLANPRKAPKKGPDNRPGRINVLAISPNVARDGTIFAGTSKAGVFRTRGTNRLDTVQDIGGPGTWSQTVVNLTIQDVSGIAISNDYNNDRWALAVGGVRIASTRSGGNDWYTYPDPVGPTG